MRIIYFALATVFATPAFAGISQDTQIVKTLLDRTTHLSIDLGQEGQAMAEQDVTLRKIDRSSQEELECMERLEDILSGTSNELHALYISFSVASVSVNAFDRKTAIELSKIGISQTQAQLPILRHSANTQIGDCANSAVVATKAQSALSLADDVENAMDELHRKYGDSKYVEK